LFSVNSFQPKVNESDDVADKEEDEFDGAIAISVKTGAEEDEFDDVSINTGAEEDEFNDVSTVEKISIFYRVDRSTRRNLYSEFLRIDLHFVRSHYQ
jgi:hypothetical protein